MNTCVNECDLISYCCQRSIHIS